MRPLAPAYLLAVQSGVECGDAPADRFFLLRPCCTERKAGALIPWPIRSHLIRTEIGRPNSSMRFRAFAAIATSVFWRRGVRDRRASPITRLYRPIAASTKARQL